MSRDWAVLDPVSGDFDAQLRRALVEDGFLYVAYGAFVPEDLVQRAFRLSEAFFALAPSEKAEIANTRSPHFRGYTRVGDETTGGVIDLREQIDFARESAPATRAAVAAAPQPSVAPVCAAVSCRRRAVSVP